MPVRFGAVEGAAAVDEHRAAPALREVALELDAGSDHVLGADREVADARADLAPLVAADAAVAAGVEAQGWRHRGQRVGEGVEIGRAHVCTPVTNAHLVCRLLLEKNNQSIT